MPENAKFNWSNKLVPGLVVVIVLMAFGMGTMWGRLQGLGSGGTRVAGTAANQPAGGAAVPSKYGSFDEAMETIANDAGLDGNKLVSCMNSGDKAAQVNADTSEGASVGVTGTPAFFINGRLLAGAYPFSEFKKVIDEELSGTPDATATRQDVNVGNAATKGSANAEVTIIEYSDFQCPFCGQAFPTIQQILSEYGDQVQFAYKHYPLSQIHPRAQKTGEAAECARDQGKFWEFHDALFQTQSEWSSL